MSGVPSIGSSSTFAGVRPSGYPPGAFERGALAALDEDERDDLAFTQGRFNETDDRLFVLLSRFELVSDLRVEGFRQPVDMGVTNTAKVGQVIPLAFEIFDRATELRDDTAPAQIEARQRR